MISCTQKCGRFRKLFMLAFQENLAPSAFVKLQPGIILDLTFLNEKDELLSSTRLQKISDNSNEMLKDLSN